MLSIVSRTFLVLLSLSTTAGLFLHDTRIDKATAVALAPLATIYENAKLVHASDFHTHVERQGVGSAAIGAFHSSVPSLQPRVAEDRKHILQRHTSRGHHAFDNSYLPIV